MFEFAPRALRLPRPRRIGGLPAALPSAPRRRVVIATGVIGALGATALVGLSSPSAAATTGFTPGNVVIYRVGTGTGALGSGGTAVALDEYSATGSLVSTVALPTAVSGANKPIVASGSAGSEGLLTLSADGRYLVATGYDATPGTTGLSSSLAASVPRTVARVDASGTVDTTTALTDFSDQNNPRSAASADGSHFWVGGGASSVRYATLGASTSTAITNSTYKNVRELQLAGGQLYTSADPTKASLTVAAIGTGAPTSGTQTPTNLAFNTAPTQPYGYSFVTLGTGSAPDTLYVADNSAGAVFKYTLSSGHWVSNGSVAVSTVSGVVANDTNGVVTLYATASGASSTAGSLYKITDSSGLGGTLSGSASLIATAPANEAFRGIAFTPGTVFGTGGAAPVNQPPTIATDHSGLAAALGDPTNPTLGFTIADTAYAATQLTVTASSSNQSVAANSGLSLTGTGGSRVLTVTPGAIGNATITLTVTAPDATTTTTTVAYGVSADLAQPTARYYSGAGNASAIIDVGGGYMVVGDDENNVLRLYQEGQSGPPVKTFDFTSLFPAGTTEIDIEAAARFGNVIYWTGSMSNTSSGNLAPSRSTLFATQVSGTGASTTLTYLGSYTGLLNDLVAWDQSNGHGLGANYLGLAASAASGVGGHSNNALNVEGMEFVGSSSAAYLGFRAPLEPTTNRHLAMLVPLTNITSIATAGNPGTTHATFGAPVFLDLGGLAVRDIHENSDGQYLISAGTADDTNSSFVLYQWDGNPADAPQRTGTTLPQIPSATNQGSWESIVSVPQPLVAGSALQLVQDDGGVVWYNDGLTSKTGLIPDLQKSVGLTLSYTAPTSVAVSVDTPNAVVGQNVTYSATVSAPTGAGTPSGTVTFSQGSTTLCPAVALDGNGAATCAASYPSPQNTSVTVTYSGASGFTTSTGSVNQHVGVAATGVTLVANPAHPVVGQPITYTATVAPTAPGAGQATGSVTFSGASGSLCAPVALSSTAPPTATCTTTYTSAQSDSVSAAYSGDSNFAGSSTSLVQPIAPAATTVTLSAAPSSVVAGQSVTFTATVAVTAPGTGRAGGTVDFSDADGAICTGVALAATGDDTASCTTTYAYARTITVTAAYAGDGNFGAAQATRQQVIDAAPSTTTLTAPSTAIVGQSVSLSAQVAVQAPGAGTPSGTVTFTDGGTTISGCDQVSLSGSAPYTAACTIPSIAVGNHSIKATYSGDTALATSSDSATLTAAYGPVATLSVTPGSATIAGGSAQTYHVTAHDGYGNDLGDVTPGTTLSIAPDGSCTVGSCTAAIPGAHTVTAVDGAAQTTATLTVTPGPSIPVVTDVVGVGDSLGQQGLDYLADGDTLGDIGFNKTSTSRRLSSFDATGDADGRTSYASGSGAAQNSQVVLRPGTNPVTRPNGSRAGLDALLADTGPVERINFVRSSQLPTAADQQSAGAKGWGALHVYQYATDSLTIAVNKGGSNAPTGLSAAELVKIYDGTYRTWGQVPGYSGPAAGDAIIALLPAAGSDVRALFDADLAAANGGPVTYLPTIASVGAGDYTAIGSTSQPQNAILPFSAGQLSLVTGGLVDAGGPAIIGLTATAPDGSASFAATHPLYIVVRDQDVATSSVWRGSTLNWVTTLFGGVHSQIAVRSAVALLTAAGVTSSYQDLGDPYVG